MDKAQKQLIDTYYRKRGIAAKEDIGSYGFKDYELNFGFQNKLIDIDLLNIKQFTEYYNYLLGTDYEYIGKFGEFGGDIALVIDEFDEYYFLNKQGELDITGVNQDKFDEYGDYDIRAAYYNQLWGTDYKEIENFNYYGNNLTLASDINDNDLFINKQGEPDITGIDYDKMGDGYILTAYNNTKDLIDKQNG